MNGTLSQVTKMSVHEIKKTSFLNVPEKLRELAQNIEEEKILTCVCIIGHTNGKVSVRAYGERTSALQTSGWLARAQTMMTEGCYASDADNFQWSPPGAS